MRQNERMGLLYGALGFALFPVGDTIVKSMSGQWAPIALAGLRYFIAALGLGLILALREGRQGFALPRPGIQIMRGVVAETRKPVMLYSVIDSPYEALESPEIRIDTTRMSPDEAADLIVRTLVGDA